MLSYGLNYNENEQKQGVSPTPKREAEGCQGVSPPSSGLIRGWPSTCPGQQYYALKYNFLWIKTFKPSYRAVWIYAIKDGFLEV